VPAAKQPVALTIAGVDSSGGAGVTVDLATFNSFEVQCKNVVTAVTAQSARAVYSVQGMRPATITAQLVAVFSANPPKAAKCGMLYSAGVVEAVAEFWGGRRAPLIIDPILVSSSGVPLLSLTGIRALKHRLLPLAKLVTPNVPEAEALCGVAIKSPEDMRKAARAIVEQYGCAAAITGGHLRGKEIVEVFFDGRDELLITSPRLSGGPWRGTGCRFTSAVTAQMAKGVSLAKAVCVATEWVSEELERLKVNG
tara:strand:- start:1230 stop:1988 length:759 start_codon:yes stop_codon:yes gene_type:complete